MEDISERIKMIRSALGINQIKMAQDLSLAQSSVAQMETGRRPVMDKTIRLISSFYNVNEDWLRTGKGNMFITKDTGITSLSPQKQAVIDVVASLPDHELNIFTNVVTAMAKRLHSTENVGNKKSPTPKGKA